MADTLQSVVRAVASVKSDMSPELSGDSRIEDLRLDSLDEVEF